MANFNEFHKEENLNIMFDLLDGDLLDSIFQEELNEISEEVCHETILL